MKKPGHTLLGIQFILGHLLYTLHTTVKNISASLVLGHVKRRALIAPVSTFSYLCYRSLTSPGPGLGISLDPEPKFNLCLSSLREFRGNISFSLGGGFFFLTSWQVSHNLWTSPQSSSPSLHCLLPLVTDPHTPTPRSWPLYRYLRWHLVLTQVISDKLPVSRSLSYLHP